VIYLVGQIAKGKDPVKEYGPSMSQQEAAAIWADIDSYRHGFISPSSMQRWLEDSADFNLPIDETHYLYDCFETAQHTGRITEDQFMKVLVGENANNQPESPREEPKLRTEASPSAGKSSPKKWNKALMK